MNYFADGDLQPQMELPGVGMDFEDVTGLFSEASRGVLRSSICSGNLDEGWPVFKKWHRGQ